MSGHFNKIYGEFHEFHMELYRMQDSVYHANG